MGGAYRPRMLPWSNQRKVSLGVPVQAGGAYMPMMVPWSHQRLVSLGVSVQVEGEYIPRMVPWSDSLYNLYKVRDIPS